MMETRIFEVTIAGETREIEFKYVVENRWVSRRCFGLAKLGNGVKTYPKTLYGSVEGDSIQIHPPLVLGRLGRYVAWNDEALKSTNTIRKGW